MCKSYIQGCENGIKVDPFMQVKDNECTSCNVGYYLTASKRCQECAYGKDWDCGIGYHRDPNGAKCKGDGLKDTQKCSLCRGNKSWHCGEGFHRDEQNGTVC